MIYVLQYDVEDAGYAVPPRSWFPKDKPAPDSEKDQEFKGPREDLLLLMSLRLGPQWSRETHENRLRLPLWQLTGDTWNTWQGERH